MTDRELLELAARAAGLNAATTECDGEDCLMVFDPEDDSGWEMDWNPLTDDGDAFRLAVKLRLNINLDCVGAICASSVRNGVSKTEESADDCAATRRAIVRAAAEIGKGMA